MLGMLSGIAGIGTAASPILGGLFVSTIGWLWVFFMNVPVAAIGVSWGHFQLKESKDSELADKTIRNMDWLGILSLTLLVCGLSLAIDNVSIEGDSFTLVGFALSANLGVYLTVMGFAAVGVLLTLMVTSGGIVCGNGGCQTARLPDSPNEPDTSGDAIDRELAHKSRPT